MIQAKNVPSLVVPTGTEKLVIPKSLSVEGLPAVETLCCGPRAMNLTFVVDQASRLECEVQLELSQVNPAEAVARCVWCFFFLSSLCLSSSQNLH